MSDRTRRAKALKTGTSAFLGLGMVVTLGLPAAYSAQADEALFKSALTSQELNSESEILSQSMKDAEGNVSVFVQFKGKGAYESTQPAAVLEGQQAPVDAQAQVQAIAAAVEKQGASVAAETGSAVLYTAHNTVRGAAIQGDAEKIRELAHRADVQSITPIVTKKPANIGTTIDTRTIDTWQQTGYSGKGVKIAIIDSGVDYTHAQFGGPGTAEAYEKASKSQDMPAADSGLYDPEKYLGGYDLVGDNYDASSTEHATPKPDANPLDCSIAGHGTHVAGTAAGFAVQQDGSTYRGDYTKITADEMRDMKIGAGSAPEAQIFSFRVFGCDGSSDVTGLALDRTLDPNNDGKFDDRADIVNMSLGSDFDLADDPDNLIVDALTRNGILSVAAAGNSTAANDNGDTYSVSGTPASAVSALAVANTIGSTTLVDKAEIVAPSDVAASVTGNYSVDFNYASATEEQLTGEVIMAPANNRYGCDAFPEGTDFKGKWVFIEWMTEDQETYPCGSAVRFNNLQKAGARGVVLGSIVEREEVGIAGNKGIPGIRLSKSAADKVRQYAEDGMLKIKLKNEWISSTLVDSGTFDQLNTSTGRGVHGSKGLVKPDVAAPGTGINSAAVAGGSAGSVKTGTSMATPHVAGIAALVLEANQSYSAPQLKAAIMNSARHDIKTADGAVQPIDRVGSGRVDALAAVNQKVLVYNATTPEQVSESFGVVEVTSDAGVQTYSRQLTVDNFDSRAHTYTLAFEASSDIPGVTISAPETVTVEAGGKTTITVTATVDPAKLEKVLDPTMAVTQLGLARQYLSAESGRLVLIEGDSETRLPLQIAPKPASAMKAVTSTVEFSKDATEASIKLEGTAIDQGGYKSLVGAYELGATSPRLKTSTLTAPSRQRVDLQYVGAATDLPSLQAAGGNVKNGVMSIGISTWENWENLTPPTAIEVSFDVDGNNRPDFYLATSRVAGLDYPLANLYGYVNGDLKVISRLPINGAFGDVDTNTFDSNVMSLPVSLADMGLTEETAANLRYKVDSYAGYGAEHVDATDWISYNPYAPKVWFEGTGSQAVGFFADAPNADITAHRAVGTAEAQALLLHLHNTTGDLSGIKKGEDGAKAEIVTLKEASEHTVVRDPRFKDVPVGHQFYKEIGWLAERGITTGYPDGTFRPADGVERAAMAAFFYRLAGSPQYTAPSTSPFKDVHTSHQFYKEIAWMAEQGITTGYPDGTFRPGNKVDRAAMAAFFYRFAGEPTYTQPAQSKFKDISSGTMFYKEISWLADQGITTGYPDGSYKPAEDVSRAAMAAFIYRYDQNVESKK